MSFFDRFKASAGIPKCSAVIVAAGSSVRMGSDKLTAPLGSAPVLVHTLRAFEKSEYVDEIVVVTRMDRVSEIADLCAQNGIGKISKVVAGGRTRMESSLIGVSAVKGSAKLIAIHDAARPLVSQALIKRTVRAAEEHKAAVPVIPSTDTLKAVGEDNRIIGTVDRETTYRVQTPQVFDAILIKGALSRAAEKGLALSDDSAAMDMTGFKSFAVAGEEDNIKITTPRDLKIAEAILQDRGEL
jgi:2-C-methyl-D-erythritol 4-phosphate cytidylyltransferase